MALALPLTRNGEFGTSPIYGQQVAILPALVTVLSPAVMMQMYYALQNFLSSPHVLRNASV